MLLFLVSEGPSVSYEQTDLGGRLFVEDLNPENHIQFAMSRWELICMGFKCIWAAVRA